MVQSGWMTLVVQDLKEVSLSVTTDRGGHTTVTIEKTSESYAVRKTNVVTGEYGEG